MVLLVCLFMSTFRHLIEEAVRLKGSQFKLAEAMGCSQQQISYLLQRAARISVEMAVKVDIATEGQVSKETLRPDIFGNQSSAVTKTIRSAASSCPVKSSAHFSQEGAR